MTLQKMINESFIKNAKKIAIIDEDDVSITYETVYEKALNIKQFLYNNKSNEDIISVMFSKSQYYIYSLIGILFAKKIFMPLDSRYPSGKIKKNFSITNCKTIITDKNISQNMLNCFEELGLNIIFIENILLEKSSCKIDLDEYFSNDAIYLYFTSGTTGTPKAILGRNKSLAHFINWQIEEFAIASNDIFIQLTSPSFDPYLRDIFTPLCAGAKIKLINRNIIFIPRLLCNLIKKQNVTCFHTTPSVLSTLLNYELNNNCFDKVKYIFIAGEMLSSKLVNKFQREFNTKTTLVNLYGPAETTLAKVFYRIEKNFSGKTVPVGKPISDTFIHIVSEVGEPCSTNEFIGEVYIQTEHMTLGYLQEGNRKKIIDDKTGWYATGDLGYISNGNLFLVGRKDDQKKIAGMRVELNEIKNVILTSNNDILNCAILYENNNLIAFYESKQPIDIEQLKRDMEDKLFSAHIPKVFLKLNKLPVTTNGKLDKNYLLKEYHKIMNFKEKIINIIKEILKLEGSDIDTNENLVDLGIDSISFVKLVMALEEKFNVEIPEDMFLTDMHNIDEINNMIRNLLEGEIK